MEVVRSAVRIKDRVLDRTEEFGNVFLVDIERFLGKFIEGLLVGRLLVELFPAAAKHYPGILWKLK